MGIVSIKTSGSTDNLDRFLKEMHANTMFDAISMFAQEGVDALEAATPKDSGITAGSWTYEITKTAKGLTVGWYNYSIDSNGTPIVILLEYGHGTGTGGYVQGYDFINPATRHVFDDISNAVWKAVQSA